MVRHFVQGSVFQTLDPCDDIRDGPLERGGLCDDTTSLAFDNMLYCLYLLTEIMFKSVQLALEELTKRLLNVCPALI